MSSAKLIDLYSHKILAYAADIPLTERLINPQCTVEKRSPLCGSMITVDLKLKDNVICGYGHEVRACALGQASASILAKNILGSNCKEIQTLRQTILFMLNGEGSAPKNKFSDYEILSPAKDYKNRHASILLALDAVVEAIDKIRSKISAK